MTTEQTAGTELLPGREALDHAAERIEELLEGDQEQAAAQALAQLHPADEADIVRDIEPALRARLLPHIEAESLAHIIEQLDGRDRGRLVNQLPRPTLARVLDRTDSDVAADVLRHIDRYDASRVLAAMLPRRAAEVMPLLVHHDESAGGRMTRGYITLLSTMTVDEAITYLRLQQPDAQEVYYLYVLGEDGRLEGVVNLRELIAHTPDTRVGDIMNQDVISVAPDTDQEECARLLRRYDLLSLPVVDDEGRLQGVMTADDLIDVITEEASEDMYRMVGIGGMAGVRATLSESVRQRIPWLLVNLATAFVAALVVSLFQDTIAEVALLAAFMPIVAGHGGNTGTQAVTLVVRGLALGEVSVRDVWRVAGQEVLFGIVHGLIAGGLTAGLAFAVSGNAWLGLVVWVAMMGNLVVAGFAGALIPLALQRLRIDPALASSIWLTTLTDVFGFLFLLGMGALLVSQLD